MKHLKDLKTESFFTVCFLCCDHQITVALHLPQMKVWRIKSVIHTRECKGFSNKEIYLVNEFLLQKKYHFIPNYMKIAITPSLQQPCR